jgi:hypothetical protein
MRDARSSLQISKLKLDPAVCRRAAALDLAEPD